MFFEIDKQTSDDLELFDNRTGKSIFAVYGRTATKGGQELMNKLFRGPASDLDFLQCRKAEINFFFNNNHCLKLSARTIDFIEHYLKVKRSPLHNNIIDATYDGIMNVISPDGDYWIIKSGILYTVQLLSDLKKFIEETEELEIPSNLLSDFELIRKFLSINAIRKIIIDPPQNIKDFNYKEINSLDYLFRRSHNNQLREVIGIVYKIDILQTLSRIMKKEGYVLPEYSTGEANVFEVADAFHPLLSSPVVNSFSFSNGSNLCFLTGPNMSGKSTFLKTMGIIIYLSHLGFPVPAKKVKISIFQGLFTTINLSDNLDFGYSHFYSEVKRVKEIASKISAERKLIVIFDELFRGTNVKDAYEASLMIISALANIKNNLFFISTHILEVAENLNKKERILFKCFESDLVDHTPMYDFKIKEGISQERMGMIIVNNEKIIEILNGVVESQQNY